MAKAQQQHDISPSEVRHYMERGQLILIDCRKIDERCKMYIPGSVHLEMENINKRTLTKYGIAKDKMIAIHCMKGGRAKKVCKSLRDEGFTNVKNLEGGIIEWKDSGLPTLHKDPVV